MKFSRLKNIIRETVWDLLFPFAGRAGDSLVLSWGSSGAQGTRAGAPGAAGAKGAKGDQGDTGPSSWVLSYSGRITLAEISSGYADADNGISLTRDDAMVIYRARGGETVKRFVLSLRNAAFVGNPLAAQLEATDTLFGSPTLVGNTCTVINPDNEGVELPNYTMAADELLIMRIVTYPDLLIDWTVEIECPSV